MENPKNHFSLLVGNVNSYSLVLWVMLFPEGMAITRDSNENISPRACQSTKGPYEKDLTVMLSENLAGPDIKP